MNPPRFSGASLRICLAWLAMIVSGLAGNVVTNTNFESEGSDKMPSSWLVFNPAVSSEDTSGLIRGNASMIAVDQSMAHNDKTALRISSLDPVRLGLVQSNLRVKPGQKLRFSCWMKGENIKSVGDGGVWVRLGFSNPSNADKHQAAYRASGFLKSRKSTFDWEFCESEVTVPLETDRVEFGLFLWRCSGTAWFAAPSVEIVEAAR